MSDKEIALDIIRKKRSQGKEKRKVQVYEECEDLPDVLGNIPKKVNTNPWKFVEKKEEACSAEEAIIIQEENKSLKVIQISKKEEKEEKNHYNATIVVLRKKKYICEKPWDNMFQEGKLPLNKETYNSLCYISIRPIPEDVNIGEVYSYDEEGIMSSYRRLENKKSTFFKIRKEDVGEEISYYVNLKDVRYWYEDYIHRASLKIVKRIFEKNFLTAIKNLFDLLIFSPYRLTIFETKERCFVHEIKGSFLSYRFVDDELKEISPKEENIQTKTIHDLLGITEEQMKKLVLDIFRKTCNEKNVTLDLKKSFDMFVFDNLHSFLSIIETNTIF